MFAFEHFKVAHILFVQQHVSAKDIFNLNIDQSILVDKCTTCSAKKIREYYLSQYKKKSFVLKFTFFIYFTNSKVSVFRSITAYNADI